MRGMRTRDRNGQKHADKFQSYDYAAEIADLSDLSIFAERGRVAVALHPLLHLQWRPRPM